MVESLPAYKDARVIVVMGSTGCGKSTIGGALARHFGTVFIEGDDHHTPENKRKMASGVPLTDDDRWPRLEQLSCVFRQTEGRVIGSCSALKKSYRQFITESVGEPVLFVYLHGTKELLAARLSARVDHFMNTELLDSQLATLEVPDSDEYSMQVSIDQPALRIVDEIAVAISH
jgi:carbohydrate kinase (thermoresistant glucokinase family)